MTEVPFIPKIPKIDDPSIRQPAVVAFPSHSALAMIDLDRVVLVRYMKTETRIFLRGEHAVSIDATSAQDFTDRWLRRKAYVDFCADQA